MEKNIANVTGKTSRFVVCVGGKAQSRAVTQVPSCMLGCGAAGFPLTGQAPSHDKRQPVVRSSCLTWTPWMMGWGFRMPGGRQAKAPLSTSGDKKAFGASEERWECSACSRLAVSPRGAAPAASPGEVGCSANPSRCPDPKVNPMHLPALHRPDGSGDRGARALPAQERRCLRRRGYRGRGEGRGRWRGGPVGAGRAGGRSQRGG